MSYSRLLSTFVIILNSHCLLIFITTLGISTILNKIKFTKSLILNFVKSKTISTPPKTQPKWPNPDDDKSNLRVAMYRVNSVEIMNSVGKAYVVTVRAYFDSRWIYEACSVFCYTITVTRHDLSTSILLRYLSNLWYNIWTPQLARMERQCIRYTVQSPCGKELILISYIIYW